MRTGVRGANLWFTFSPVARRKEMTRTNPENHQTQRRRIGAAVTLTLGLLLAVLLPAGAANAAAYRYWGYYQLTGTTWNFATKGPDQTAPADGSVEGWRFAVGSEDVTRFPRATPTFDDVCGDTKAETGNKRVAVVIDYGRAADTADNTEPPAAVGRCAVVATTATGLEVLSKVAAVRSDKGLVCGLDGFPASGCGDEVKTVSAEANAADTAVTLKLPTADEPAAAKTDEDDDSHTGTYVGIGVAVLAAAAVAVAALRRRRA
jgi:MYXO-CTERM domain-containing protein